MSCSAAESAANPIMDCGALLALASTAWREAYVTPHNSIWEADLTISMYEASVPVFAHMLGALSNVLAKGEANITGAQDRPGRCSCPRGWRPTCSR